MLIGSDGEYVDSPSSVLCLHAERNIVSRFYKGLTTQVH